MADSGETLVPGSHQGARDTSADGWITLAEAAQQLGISLDAARRRMRRGDFPRRQARTRHGVTWQVRLTPADDADPGASLASTLVPTVALEPSVEALLAYLRERDRARDAEVAQLREDLARARADLVEQAAQLALTQEQLRALHSPTEPAPASLTESERQELEVLRAEHEVRLRQWERQPAPSKRPPWWRRWLGATT